MEAVVILYAADRAVHAGHSARDARALKCRAGRACTAHHKVRISKYKFSVGTKVYEQREFWSVPDHAHQSTCSDISAHIASDIRSNDDVSVFINFNVHI